MTQTVREQIETIFLQHRMMCLSSHHSPCTYSEQFIDALCAVVRPEPDVRQLKALVYEMLYATEAEGWTVTTLECATWERRLLAWARGETTAPIWCRSDCPRPWRWEVGEWNGGWVRHCTEKGINFIRRVPVEMRFCDACGVPRPTEGR